MIIKTKYSPNYSKKSRDLKDIKFIIIHYTGMRKEASAIERLCNVKFKVSAHYFIKKNGSVLNLVPPLYEAWHAGKSGWKNFKFLNRYSIGIEIQNSGHDNKYENFTQKQIISTKKLLKCLINKFNVKSKNILGHSDIAPNRKKDPGEKFPWKYLAKNKIGLWHSLSYDLLNKNRKIKLDYYDKKIFFKNLSKIGYSISLSKNSNKNNHLKLIVKAFQRRFRQELIDGKIDRECLIISENLTNKFK